RLTKATASGNPLKGYCLRIASPSRVQPSSVFTCTSISELDRRVIQENSVTALQPKSIGTNQLQIRIAPAVEHKICHDLRSEGRQQDAVSIVARRVIDARHC